MMTNFTNDQIEVKDLPDWQVVNFEPVATEYKTIVIVRFVIMLFVYSILVFIVSKLNENSFDVSYWLALFIGNVLLITVCVLSVWSVGYWGYAIREHDVLYRSGIFSKSVQIIPYKHIQHVHVKEGLFSRMFKLSNVEVHTAGMGQSLNIPGIKKEKSLQIQDFLSAKIRYKG